jgi:hypothetical protein
MNDVPYVTAKIPMDGHSKNLVMAHYFGLCRRVVADIEHRPQRRGAGRMLAPRFMLRRFV